MKVLVSWIGHTDLKSLLGSGSQKIQDDIKAIVRPPYTPPEDGGPIKTLLNQESFDRVYFLSDNPKSVTCQYVKWLEIDATVHYSHLANPTDYAEIYTVASKCLESIGKDLASNNHELSILLSPGTPAMAAIWVLLGKTKYSATFWQTWGGKAKQEDVPFDITLDVVPELISGSDSVFHHLATKSPDEVEGFEDIIGKSKAIRLAVGRAQKAAIRDVSVLLSGESGTGKEMFARAIHKASPRRDKPFIPINCAAIPKELLESELFGHTKGAFTGADKNREGAFKRADGGILFLDEIGECDPQIQAKLLRVLQPPHGKSPCSREFYPVGATKQETADVRIIAATNRNLIEMVENNLFREDLFYRLALIAIKLPALRERKTDIAPIAEAMLRQINQDFSSQDKLHKDKSFYPSTITFINRYTWPGNVRELYNAILQAVVMADKEQLSPDDIKAALTQSPEYSRSKVDLLEVPLGDGFDLEEHLNNIQRHYLRRAMQESGGIKTKAASLLGIKSYQAMDAQIKRLNVDLGGL
jgi:transcriptional regulator with PAS, ATPase and Fis domain